MKILVVYYSSDGNTRIIANAIAKDLNAHTLELIPKRDIPKKGIMRYYWGGKLVLTGQKVALEMFARDPQEYDLLFIGTPVWAFSFTPALKTFFKQTQLKNKKVALFCCHAGMKGATLEKMKKHLLGNTILGEIDFYEPRESFTEAQVQKAREWAKSILETFKGH